MVGLGRPLGPLVLALLVACDGGADDTADTAAPADSGDVGDTAAETGNTGGDTADTGDTGDTGGLGDRTGRLGYRGSATADTTTYAGAEEWYFVADDGEGADLCRIRYTLTAVEGRTDCGDCVWAHDLEVSGAAVLAESGPGCLELAGVDASTVGSLDGTVVSYGYTDEYLGHAEAMLSFLGGAWVAIAYADWDETTGAFAYDRVDGTFTYAADP